MRQFQRVRPLLAAALLTLIAAPGARAQLFRVSESDELAAGRQADAQIRQQYRISNDSYMNGLVRYLGQRLARASDRPNLPWTFRVIDSPDINAFSVPSYVYVNSGLINFVHGDQQELAGVIAHEIGHTCGRHAAKQMSQQAEIGLFEGLLTGGRSRTIQSLANVAGNLVMLGFSRGDENDADARAVKYMLRAGYDPNALVRFFEDLKQKEGNGGGGLVTYFQTHPPTSDRIKRVENEIVKDGGHLDTSGPYAAAGYSSPYSRSSSQYRGSYNRSRTRRPSYYDDNGYYPPSNQTDDPWR